MALASGHQSSQVLGRIALVHLQRTRPLPALVPTSRVSVIWLLRQLGTVDPTTTDEPGGDACCPAVRPLPVVGPREGELVRLLSSTMMCTSLRKR